jgi:hypothetical protein
MLRYIEKRIVCIISSFAKKKKSSKKLGRICWYIFLRGNVQSFFYTESCSMPPLLYSMFFNARIAKTVSPMQDQSSSSNSLKSPTVIISWFFNLRIHSSAFDGSRFVALAVSYTNTSILVSSKYSVMIIISSWALY